MDRRQLKGLEIARTGKVEKDFDGWIVPSQTDKSKVYHVDDNFVCDCPDCQKRKLMCKHGYAAKYSIKVEITTPKGTIMREKRLTYPQAWAIYNKCQENEKQSFMELLKEICLEIEEPVQTMGRPRESMRDLLFASALKVYSQFSLRRFRTDLKAASEQKLVEQTPSRSAISEFMNKEELTPILTRLIQLSALPLKDLETQFAIDSSGFRTTKFNEYCKIKHNTLQHHEWLKCHIMTGVKTNIITAVKIGLEDYSADSPNFIPLLNTTAGNGFDVKEVSADKAYSSIANYDAVDKLGGKAYIAFRNNAQESTKISKQSAWNKMYHYFQLNSEKFMEKYHKRSNVETTFFMIKSKFNDMLKSKMLRAQVNELLLKVLCHNIVVVNNEMNVP